MPGHAPSRRSRSGSSAVALQATSASSTGAESVPLVRRPRAGAARGHASRARSRTASPSSRHRSASRPCASCSSNLEEAYRYLTECFLRDKNCREGAGWTSMHTQGRQWRRSRRDDQRVTRCCRPTRAVEEYPACAAAAEEPRASASEHVEPPAARAARRSRPEVLPGDGHRLRSKPRGRRALRASAVPRSPTPSPPGSPPPATRAASARPAATGNRPSHVSRRPGARDERAQRATSTIAASSARRRWL